MQQLTNFQTRDVEALLHPTTNLAVHKTAGPLLIDKAKGVFVWDDSGKRYIEGLAGLWCTGLGYGNAELVEAAREQMSRLSSAVMGRLRADTSMDAVVICENAP